MRNRVSVALACSLSLIGSSAFAYAESSAAINSIQFQLIDLVPQDGAASFQFGSGKTALSISTSDGGTGDSDSIAKTRAGTFGFAETFASQLDHASATASISADQLKASGSASGSNSNYSSAASTGVSNSYPYYNSGYNLTLSANSMLVITAEASVFASATNPTSGGCYYCSPSESASASANMLLNYSYSNGNTSVSYSFNDSVSTSAQARGAYVSQEFAGYRQVAYTYYGTTYYYTEAIYNNVSHALQEETKSASKYLTAVFVNSTNTAVSASLYFGVSASGLANSAAVLPVSVVAVPEADAAWLLLAGMGVVGGVVARRRKA